MLKINLKKSFLNLLLIALISNVFTVSVSWIEESTVFSSESTHESVENTNALSKKTITSSHDHNECDDSHHCAHPCHFGHCAHCVISTEEYTYSPAYEFNSIAAESLFLFQRISKLFRPPLV